MFLLAINFQYHECFASEELSTEGKLECSKKASTNKMNFFNLRRKVIEDASIPDDDERKTNSSKIILINVKGAANNGCIAGSPNIDYEGTFEVDLATRSVKFTGLIEPFPAFEIYFSINNGAPYTLYREMPLEGKTPWDLYLGPSRAVDGGLNF